jgi:hypothetical protein
MANRDPNSGRIELEGKIFGSWTVLHQVKIAGSYVTRYECVCECGTKKTLIGQQLRKGMTTSCGCKKSAKISTANSRHGKSRTTVHNIWLSMRQRCEDERCKAFEAYGGRGIRVCEEWQKFEQFLVDMGEPSAGMSIERIDNDKGYAPSNCRWATKREQANNRRSSVLLQFNGKRMTQAAWERELGLSPGRIYDRLYKGWTLERALSVRGD